MNLKDETNHFKEPTKPKIREKKEPKALSFNNATRLFNERQKIPNGFESKIFLIEKQVQILSKCYKDS